MKKLLVLVSVFALAACSSKDKEEMSVEEAPAVTEAPAEMPAEAPIAEPEPTPAPSDGGGMAMPASGEFPSITGTERMTANCTSGSASRTISVIDISDNGGCGVVYTKSNEPRTVAMAQHDMGYCDKVFENIKGNLTAGGMDCGEGAGAAAPAEPAAEKADGE